MIKLITPGSYDFGEPAVSMIPFSQRGLVGADKHGFLKRASNAFMAKLANFKPLPGEVPVHIIALGSTEAYGPNRNGDGFEADVCRKYAHTFEKHAHYFRNHQNKDPKKSYGRVKFAAFNEDMQRIELIAVLNATKEAAARNGGLIADLELAKLAKHEDVPTSMGTHVPYDICSGCGHKARFRREYCDEKQCTKYGGLKHNIGRTFDDGHTMHARNPSADWFDISTVGRNADRISFNLGVLDGYRDMLKAASDHTMLKVSGAAWAERCGVTLPGWVLLQNEPWMGKGMVRQLKAAGLLIEAEDAIQQEKIAANPLPFQSQVRRSVDFSAVQHEKLGSVLQSLHERHCLLPLTDFLVLITKESREKVAALCDTVSAALPSAVNRLVSDVDFERQLEQNPYVGDQVPGMRTRAWASKYASDLSMERTRVVERAQLAVMRNVQPVMFTKTASVTPSAEGLAREYALYEIAFLAAQPEDASLQRTADYIVQHNYAQ